jgi:hypothetical protein
LGQVLPALVWRINCSEEGSKFYSSIQVKIIQVALLPEWSTPWFSGA